MRLNAFALDPSVVPALLSSPEGFADRGWDGFTDFDLTKTAVSEWVKQADIHAGAPPDLDTGGRNELRLLRFPPGPADGWGWG